MMENRGWGTPVQARATGRITGFPPFFQRKVIFFLKTTPSTFNNL
jgi:hypothetical protein